MFTKRQQQIVETAIGLIAHKGIQNLTIKNLALQIGISEPALYRHFKNKLEIMKSILKYFQLTMQPSMLELKKEGKAIDKINDFIFKHYEILNQKQNLAKIIFAEANFQNDETLKDSLLLMMNNSQRLMQGIIQQAQENDEINTAVTAKNLTRMIIGSMRFMIIQWSMSGMIFDIEAEGKLLCEDLKKIMR
ncbi:MAG: TetR/AcrR family transcriptional regulator [Candidatus Cloacimonetes bacterium]|jgi:TetR/AcrR family transcriptional regulator, fatty acid metabolism regulator protein|nr:TetR/AcrR family transcriptional regulator [Candidatus Cloacimonadota bacterium]MBT6763179.1 TetR/AcrR family transcriptional regulator [Prolixibacteraceae bacterium]MBT6994489.1 TetR/AcrR family transcriptional regulator [Candidatus Cloacimonadota bacterium]MBT7469973.1 TetR/AcrR family transcriptional regulator [Candidatus Cloacimonadota bacterium]